MDIVDFVMQQLMPVVDGLKAKDKNFASEYEARKSELRDFADLIYKQCSKDGARAAYCPDKNLEGQLVHFFHEPKGVVKTLDLDVKQFKNESSAKTSTSGAKTTTSKTSGTKTTTTSKTASSKPTTSVKTPAPAPVAPAPPVAPTAPAPAPPKASAPAPKPKIMDLF